MNLLIAHYRPDIVSGAENSIADLVDQLDPRFRVTMLVPGPGRLADFYHNRKLRVWIRRIETPRRLFPGLHSLQSRLFARELRQQGLDLVLCNTFPAASRVAKAAQFANLPVVIYMRDYIADTPLHRKMLGQAKALFAISKDVINKHEHMARPDQFRLAYNFINPDPILDRYEAHLASGNRLLPFASQQPVVGLVGRITPNKQPDLFIRAAAQALQSVPGARFALIGKAQPRERAFENHLKALADHLGLRHKIAFLGQRNDAVEVSSEFTISCLTSTREPLGRVILEAHLLGVPVIVPDVGGPAEIVENEVNGLTFSPQSPDAETQLAHQIIRLLNDPDLRDCLATKGRERVMNTFASRRHVRVQEEYFDQIISSRASRH